MQHLFFYITYSGTWLIECSGHGPNTTDIEITGIAPLAVCDWETVKFYPWVCYFSYTQHPYQYRFCLWISLHRLLETGTNYWQFTWFLTDSRRSYGYQQCSSSRRPLCCVFFSSSVCVLYQMLLVSGFSSLHFLQRLFIQRILKKKHKEDY